MRTGQETQAAHCLLAASPRPVSAASAMVLEPCSSPNKQYLPHRVVIDTLRGRKLPCSVLRMAHRSMAVSPGATVPTCAQAGEGLQLSTSRVAFPCSSDTPQLRPVHLDVQAVRKPSRQRALTGTAKRAPTCTASRAGSGVPPFSVTESMEKATRRPFSFSMISGCCVVTATPCALPEPALCSSTPMLAGSDGSMAWGAR